MHFVCEYRASNGSCLVYSSLFRKNSAFLAPGIMDAASRSNDSSASNLSPRETPDETTRRMLAPPRVRSGKRFNKLRSCSLKGPLTFLETGALKRRGEEERRWRSFFFFSLGGKTISGSPWESIKRIRSNVNWRQETRASPCLIAAIVDPLSLFIKSKGVGRYVGVSRRFHFLREKKEGRKEVIDCGCKSMLFRSILINRCTKLIYNHRG